MTLLEVSKLHCTQIFTFKDFSALDKLLQTAAWKWVIDGDIYFDILLCSIPLNFFYIYFLFYVNSQSTFL